uniref:FHA domain-containing protein n=1 Tax=Schistosoma haematobium TaxID=6185 RepID=A0A094ZED0_SCHHA
MNPSGHIVVIRRDGTDGLTCDWCSPLCDIGSNQSCDIRVQHSTVAPFHCTLQLLKDGLVQAVSRVDGRYKMLVNNFPLNDACVLTDNCILTVGDRQFRFFYPSSRKTTTDNYLYETSSKTPKHYNKEEVITPTSLPVVHPSKRTTPRKILVNPKTRSPRQRSVTPKRTLGTNERYGPVPPRQPATPPIIQVLRHEPNSSQSKQLPVLQAENVEFNKKSVGDGKGYSCTDVSVSKSNQTKSSVVPDLPDTTFHPSSSVLSSIKVRSQNRIHTPIITSTLSNDHFNFTPNENKRSPGFRKSFHKLLILNESSNQSNLCKINQFYDELSYVKQQVIESKRSPSNEQENQSCYDKCLDHPTEGSREYIPELPTSPNSLRIARKLSAKSSQKISIAYSPETEQELISRNRKRTISGKTYPVAEDMLAPKRRRGVSFGPPLSPERFDKSLPPSTPVKRGETPLVKISHSTPANHSLQVTSVVGHSATPFDSKLSEVSHLSDFSKTCESPNYSVTHNRVSAVISLPPTPDTNLLNSLSTDISCAHESFANFPVTSAAYSAPIKKSSVSRKNFKRHSLGFLEKTSKTPSPRVPPTSPVSTKQNRKNKSTNEHNPKIQEKKSKSFHTYEEESVTPEKSLLSPRKESGLTGVRKLMRTPKPVQTPRISGVSKLFIEEPSVKVHCCSRKLSGVTSLSRRHCKSCRCLLSACQCGFDYNCVVNKCSMRKCSDVVVESLSSIRTRRVVKIAKSSVDKSANSDCSILKKLPGKFSSQSTNEVTVQPSKTRSKTKRNVSTMDSQYRDSLSDRSMSVGKSLDKRMLKELTEVVVPFPHNVMENHSRKGKTLTFTSRLTPNDTSNSCDQSALLKMGFIENSHPTVSFSSNTSKDRESDSVVPVASRLRNRRIPSSIECLSSSRTRRAVKAPDPLINESATKGSSGKSSVMKTSSRKVVSQSNNEVAIQPSKTRSKTKKRVFTKDSQFPDPLLNHSVNATKSANNTSKRSIKRLAEVRRVSSSIPLAKRLRSRIDQLDIKCITSEHTQNEERSLPVKNQSGEEKKKNGTMTNNPRNRKQLITSKSKLLPTTSSSKSASTNESKNITTLKVKTNSRHIKRISVTPVDNIANVSPKRRVLRSRKLITTSSEISQPIEEKISTSKITNKSKLKTTTTTTTNNNNNNNRSVVSKSSQAKQSPVSIRQTRSRKKQTATNNL